MSKTSPTRRALAECKRRGWTAQVVEKWIPHTRRRLDLFGVIDIVAIVPPTDGIPGACQCEAWGEHECACGNYQAMMGYPGRIVGIQATSGTNHNARVVKSKAEPRLSAWLNANAEFLVWSFAKRGPRGKAKRWVLREEAVTYADGAVQP